jgi:hypothetical protein
MLIRKEQDLTAVHTEVFNLLVGFNEEQKRTHKQRASRRACEARRAIERHLEARVLNSHIDTARWLEEA